MRTTSVTGKRQPGAFTLVELLLAIIIIGVAAAVSIPLLRQTADAVALEESCRRIYYLSGLLSDLAQRQERMYYLKIDLRRGEFSAAYKNDQGALQPLQTSAARAYKLPDGVTVATEPKEMNGIYFYPDSSSDKAMVTFGNAAGRKIGLEFGGLNGSISIRGG